MAIQITRIILSKEREKEKEKRILREIELVTASASSGKEYEEFPYIEHTREDGSVQKVKVPIQFMDITD
ncbi:hypothetical protein FRC05_003520 [Tulasnella sp. 425]|nr:hypothetical protein FRC05_003520 [Tulasnella sp. 425]